WLAIIAADLAVKALHLALPNSGLSGAYPVTRPLPFLYAPLFFLYGRVLTTGFGPGWRDVPHAAWFMLALGWAVGRWWSGAALADDAPWHSSWFDPVLFAVAFGYLAAAMLKIPGYRQWLRQR